VSVPLSRYWAYYWAYFLEPFAASRGRWESALSIASRSPRLSEVASEVALSLEWPIGLLHGGAYRCLSVVPVYWRRFLDGRPGQGPLDHPCVASTAEAGRLACLVLLPARLLGFTAKVVAISLT
jgi:hypothetical protein